MLTFSSYSSRLKKSLFIVASIPVNREEIRYCNKPLTGSWSRGKTKKYAYYHCNTKSCKFGNIRKEKLETIFVETLQSLEPSEKVLELFDHIIIDIWDTKKKDSLQTIAKLENDIKTLKEHKRKIADLVIVGTFDDKTYKDLNNDIDSKIAFKTIQLNELSLDYQDIESCINQCSYFLRNISKLWMTSDISLRIKFQNIIFPEGVVYFNGTLKKDNLSTIFRVLKLGTVKESTLAAHKGLELSSDKPHKPYG